MPTPPPLPPWEGLHPLVVHFPIALLFVAPLFVLIGAVTGARAYLTTALLLLVLGTIGAFVATNTGEAAYDAFGGNEANDLLDPDLEYGDVADEHKVETEFARNVFTGITVCFAVWVIAAYTKASSMKTGPRLAVGAAFLAVLMWGNLLMAVAAHKGGELVHRYAVLAVLPEPEEEAEEEPEAEAEETAEAESPAGDGAE